MTADHYNDNFDDDDNELISPNEMYSIDDQGRVTFTEEGLREFRPYFERFGIMPRLINNTKRLNDLFYLINQLGEDKRLSALELEKFEFIKRRKHLADKKQDFVTADRLYQQMCLIDPDAMPY